MVRGRLVLLKRGEPALTAYKCPAGVWTIGWGHTGPDVVSGSTITLQRAEELFREDASKFERAVTRLIAGGAATTQGQFDAMVSLAYNVGEGRLAKSTLLKLHRRGNYEGAAAQFALWNKSQGRVLPGLTRRRADETLFYQRRVQATKDLVDTTDTRIEPDPPKPMTQSRNIIAAGASAVAAVPITVEGVTMVADGAKELKQTVDDTAMFAWLSTVLGGIIILLSAYLIFRRIRDRSAGVK
jgi:lysozyme